MGNLRSSQGYGVLPLWIVYCVKTIPPTVDLYQVSNTISIRQWRFKIRESKEKAWRRIFGYRIQGIVLFDVQFISLCEAKICHPLIEVKTILFARWHNRAKFSNIVVQDFVVLNAYFLLYLLVFSHSEYSGYHEAAVSPSKGRHFQV